MPVGWLFLLLAVGQLPAAALEAPAEQVEVQADLAEYDAEARQVRAEGHVRLKSGGLLLRAGELTLDLDRNEVRATGDITLVDGNAVAFAREGVFGLGGERRFLVSDAELLLKAPGNHAALHETVDRAALWSLGRNSLVLRAATLERIDLRRYRAEGLRFTPCDCAGEPDWSIAASSADIEPGERAVLFLPRIYIKGVPVMVLPALYVPLSSRRTGLLFPRPKYSRQNGFALDQPLFLALGESYDATLTAGYVFGVSEPQPPGRVGASGFRGTGEFRYAPSLHTSGRLFVAGILDRHHDVDAGNRYLEQSRGLRGELSWRHASRFPNGFSAVADVNLVSDGHYLNDAAVDVFRDAPPYLRSQAFTAWRGEDALAVGAVQLYQDLTVNTPSRRLFGEDAPVTLQRLPALTLYVPRTAIVGGLRAGMEATALRYQPLAPFAGRDALSAAPPPQMRLDLSPSFLLPLLESGPVRAGLLAGARGDLRSAFPAEGATGYALATAGAYASTELSRIYGAGATALRHTIEPRLELRAGTPHLSFGRPGPGAEVVLDEYDVPSPSLGFAQAVASVSNRLAPRSGVDLGRLEVGQGFDLGTMQAADAFARLDTGWRFVSATAEARYDVRHRAMAQTSVWSSLNDGAGNSLYVGFDRLLSGTTARMRNGLDSLFGWPPPASRLSGAEGRFNQLSAGVSVSPFKRVSLRYGATLRPFPEGKTKIDLLQQTAGISLGTACDCWRVDVYAAHTPEAWPSVGFSLDLTGLGSVGGGS